MRFLEVFSRDSCGYSIGIDPYYLTYKAKQLGYHSQIIMSGRRINDDMGRYVAENILKNEIKAGVSIMGAKVAILGFTFNENCPDIWNTKVIDIVNELKEYGIHIVGFDDIKNMDVVVLAVSHSEYLNLSMNELNGLFQKGLNDNKVIIDIKGILPRDKYEKENYIYWRL